MVICDNFDFPPNECPGGNYTACHKQITCHEQVQSCFAIWYHQDNRSIPLSAGCLPNFNPNQIEGDSCAATECIGVPKGRVARDSTWKYFCCCSGDNCNENLITPKTIPFEDDLDLHEEGSPWIMATMLVLSFIGLLLLFTWWRRNSRGKDIGSVELSLGGADLNESTKPLTTQHDKPDEEETRPNNESAPQAQKQPSIPVSAPGPGSTLLSTVLLEKIGVGRFASVFKAKKDDEIVAVKVIPSKEVATWTNERDIYSNPGCKHGNIVIFHFGLPHPETDSYWLVLEYVARGSLYNYLKGNTLFWDETVKVALGISLGMRHLHEFNIAHRDFKSLNVLLKHDLTPLITDFGVACTLPNRENKYPQVGTPRYMAPEVLECSIPFDNMSFAKTDVYSMALVLWEILSRCKQIPSKDPSLMPEEEGPLDVVLPYIVGPYQVPFEKEAGPNPDIELMKQLICTQRLRPTIRSEWEGPPVDFYLLSINDGLAYDSEARVSSACIAERLSGLPVFNPTESPRELKPQLKDLRPPWMTEEDHRIALNLSSTGDMPVTSDE